MGGRILQITGRSTRRVLEEGAKDLYLRQLRGSHCGHLEIYERIKTHNLVQKQEHFMLNVSTVQDDVP